MCKILTPSISYIVLPFTLLVYLKQFYCLNVHKLQIIVLNLVTVRRHNFTSDWLFVVSLGFGSQVMLSYFLLPSRPDRLWGPTSHIANRYRGPFPRRQDSRYTTPLYLLSWLRMRGALHPIPLC